jgi:hypothetical protein
MSEVINEADALMRIWGYKRVICAECRHSIGTDAPMLLCNSRQVLVERTAQCRLFEREAGSDHE